MEMIQLKGIFYCSGFVLIKCCILSSYCALKLIVEIVELTLYSPFVIVLTPITSNWCYAISKIQVKKKIKNSQGFCS